MDALRGSAARRALQGVRRVGPAREPPAAHRRSVDEEAARALAVVDVLLGLVVGLGETVGVTHLVALVAPCLQVVDHLHDLIAIRVGGGALPVAPPPFSRTLTVAPTGRTDPPTLRATRASFLTTWVWVTGPLVLLTGLADATPVAPVAATAATDASTALEVMNRGRMVRLPVVCV